MIIFGKAEREQFDAGRDQYAPEVKSAYDLARTYRDGKWIMFMPTDSSLFDDFLQLLAIKRKPSRSRMETASRSHQE